MITEQDVIEKLAASENFSLGEKGTVHIWRDGSVLGLLIYQHWTSRTGFIGRTLCDNYEISGGCIDSSNDEPVALDTLLKALSEFKPYELPSTIKRARFMLWGIDNIRDRFLKFKTESLSWKNKAHAIDVFFRDAGVSHSSFFSRWGERIREMVGEIMGDANHLCSVDELEGTRDGPFVVSFEWQPEEAGV
tara:strand:+ start:2017 stop:2589 length:573 start_codon:yes stop_codon:yes gene_type:complete